MITDADEAARMVVRLGCRVAAAGLVVGAGGNISARTGIDELMVTPRGAALDELHASDLVTLALDGSPPAARARASSEVELHLAAHATRPDATVALHVHPPHANLLVAMGRAIRLITLDHSFYVRRMAQVPYLPAGTVELADAVAERLDGVDVVLMGHHGCLVLAPDGETAYERAANLEAAAVATYRALLLGDTTTACPPEYLADVEARERSARPPLA